MFELYIENELGVLCNIIMYRKILGADESQLIKEIERRDYLLKVKEQQKGETHEA